MRTRIKGLGWLITIALAGILASIAVDQDPLRTLIGSSVLRMTIKAVALAFSAGSGVFSYVRSEQRHAESSEKQARKESIESFEEMLLSAIQNLFVGEMTSTIRANVMLTSGEVLEMLASANMRIFPDYDVRLRKGQGCAGVAWEHAVQGSVDDFWKPLYASQTQLTVPQLKRRWHLSDDQIRLTRHILWILSIPLFRKSEAGRTFIGVLNIDGVHDPLQHPERLAQREFLGRCVAVGERIAEEATRLTAARSAQYHLNDRRKRESP